jgi:hypothetical protein
MNHYSDFAGPDRRELSKIRRIAIALRTAPS